MMRVDSGYSYANTFTSKPTESATGADFSKVIQEAKSTNKTAQVATVDQASEPASSAPNFRSMTVADLRSWVNNELEQGRMTLDESSAFAALAVVIPTDNKNDYNYSLNVEKRDFIENAKASIQNGQQRNDRQIEQQFQNALDIMERSQAVPRIFESV